MKYLGILLFVLPFAVSAYDVDTVLTIPQDNYGPVTFNGDSALNGAVVATYSSTELTIQVDRFQANPGDTVLCRVRTTASDPQFGEISSNYTYGNQITLPEMPIKIQTLDIKLNISMSVTVQ